MSGVDKNPRLGVLDKIAIFSLFLLLSSLFTYIYSPVFNSNAGTAIDGTEAYRASIQVDDNVEISITPSSTQAIYSAANTVSYTNTCPAGFYLYFSSTSDDTTLKHQSELLSIPTTSSDTSLTDNSWGYSTDNETTYHPIPTPENSALLLDVTSINTTANDLNVYLGVKTDNSLKSGAYVGDVMYTVVVKETCYAYDVSWDANSGTNPENLPDAINLDGTINLSMLAKPTRSYYNFSGWTNGSTIFTGDETDANINPDREPSVTMIALWDPTPYSISYDLDGGGTDNPTTYNIESSEITLRRPTKAGFKFLGWSGTGIDELSTSVTIPAGSHGDRSYEAHWEEACSLEPQEFSYTNGRAVAHTIAEGCGGAYKLEVWGAQGGSCCYGGTGGKGGYAGGNITLDEGTTIYVTVGNQGSSACPSNTNGSEGYGGGGQWTFMSKTNTTYANTLEDDLYISSSAGGGGACFRRWDDQGNDRSYNRNGGVGTGFAGLTINGLAVNGSTSMPTYDGTSSMTGNSGKGHAKITYVEDGYTITFDANGGSVDPVTKNVPVDDPQIGSMPIPTNGNKKFLGWYMDDTLTTIVYATTPVYDDMTLYAKWMDDNVVDFTNTKKTIGIRIPEMGTYKLEVWGAQGGSCCYGGTGGKGGYAGGNIILEEGTVVYVTVGSQGTNACPSNTNGSEGYGGSGSWTYMSKTDTAYSSTEHDDLYLSSSAGSGGACFMRWTNEGENVSYHRNGSVGIGSINFGVDNTAVAGNVSMPTHDNAGTMTGNTGNGYAKITFVE